MDSKTTGIVAYLSWIGWIIAIAAGTRDEHSNIHLNNALVCLIFGTGCGFLCAIPLLGLLFLAAAIVVFVFAIIGFVAAIKGEDKEVPLIGKIHIIK